MNRFGYAFAVTAFLFATTTPVRADDAADAKAIIEKAVKAHGGQDKLTKFTGSVITFKGTFHGAGEATPMSGTVTTSGSDKQKVDIEVDAGGMKIPITIVVAGDKGWSKIAKDTMEMDKDQIAEAKEQAYAAWVATLAPLTDKQFKFATTGEIKVNNRAAVGVKVTSKGHRDIDLYFDKETNLLVKSETRVKDEMSGQEVSEESFPSDYKEVQGTKQAMKFAVKRNGKAFMEGESSKVELFEKIDANTFEKP